MITLARRFQRTKDRLQRTKTRWCNNGCKAVSSVVPGAAHHTSSLPSTRLAATAALRQRPGIDCPAVDPWDRPGRAICLAATATAMHGANHDVCQKKYNWFS